jgi:hypothetical protein
MAQPWLNLLTVRGSRSTAGHHPGRHGSERGTSAKYWSDLKSIPAKKEGRSILIHLMILWPDRGSEWGPEEIARLHPSASVNPNPDSIEEVMKVLDQKMIRVNGVLLVCWRYPLSAAPVNRCARSVASFAKYLRNPDAVTVSRQAPEFLGVAIGGGMAACGVAPSAAHPLACLK